MVNFFKENKSIVFITISAFIVSLVFIFTNRIEEIFIFWSEIMDFIYGICLSIISAFIFYIFQVYLPNKKRRNIIKKHLSKSYLYFKEKTIENFLIAINRQDIDTDILLTFEWFNQFFSEKISDTQTNWHNLINKYEDNPSIFKELIYDLSSLEKEISFILDNLEIIDEELFCFMKVFKERIDWFKDLWDDKERYEFYYKNFWGFLWSIYSWWDIVSWQRETDIIEDMIDKI